MKASWEKLEKNEGVLTVEVDENEVNSALDQAFKKVVKQVNVPGFRKGRVPRKIFEAKFGVESLYQDALDILLPKAYTQAVEETGIEPIDQPEVDVEQMEKDLPLKFTAKVQIPPEVKLGEYKGLEVPKKDFSVSDEDVEQELKSLQERHAELNVVEDGAAEEGDTVILDFEGFIDGEAFEGGSAENHTLEIGSNSFIPGFEEQLVGLAEDDEKEISVTFPEDYHSEEVAGKDAVFKVKIHEIKRKQLPELDDDFAMDVSEFETFEEYKKDLREKLEEAKAQEKEQYEQNAVVEKASEAAEVDIPDVMIENEMNQMVTDFEQRLSQQGMPLDMYFQFTGQNIDSLREQMKPDAEKRVLGNLVLQAIMEKEGIEASEERVDEELSIVAEANQKEVSEVREMLEANGSLEMLQKQLGIQATIDFLLEHCKFVDAVEEEDEKDEEAK